MKKIEQQRKLFEEWISQPPFERGLERFSEDEKITSWPGQYRHYEVQLAWEAWQTALEKNTP